MKNKTILIIDDNQDTRSMYADIFRASEFKVHTAVDGLEGIDFAKKHLPDVIFTGIMMPRMDGFATMEALSQYEETKNIPVVINSHLGRQEDRKRAEECGAKDFIVRGMTPPNEIVQRIDLLVSDKKTFTIEPDIYAKDAQKLADKLGLNDNLLQCQDGSKIQMSITIDDIKNKTGAVKFICK